MSEEFRFLYNYKRGDACNYCGTVFGYDVESEIGACAKYDAIVAFQGALAEAKRRAKEEALFRPCPRCGRLPSEAYARQLGCGTLFLAAVLPVILGTAVVTLGVMVKFLRTDGAIIAAYALAAFGCAVWLCYHCVYAHRVFFRPPAMNLEASKEKSEVNRDDAKDTAFGRERNLRKALFSGLSGREREFMELPMVLGTRPECATRREMKGRRFFWAFSMVRIAAPFAFAAPFVFATLAAATWARGLDGDALFAAAILFLPLLWLAFVWAGNDAIRCQGERHFGCGWNRASLRAELAEKLKGREGETQAELEALRRVELDESARAVEVLRATTDLTPEGAFFLQIAEEEAEELEALRQKEKEKNGENAKPTPSANVATEETFEEARKKAFGEAFEEAFEEAGEKATKKAAPRKDAELDASAKRLSKYERR